LGESGDYRGLPSQRTFLTCPFPVAPLPFPTSPGGSTELKLQLLPSLLIAHFPSFGCSPFPLPLLRRYLGDLPSETIEDPPVHFALPPPLARGYFVFRSISLVTRCFFCFLSLREMQGAPGQFPNVLPVIPPAALSAYLTLRWR